MAGSVSHPHQHRNPLPSPRNPIRALTKPTTTARQPKPTQLVFRPSVPASPSPKKTTLSLPAPNLASKPSLSLPSGVAKRRTANRPARALLSHALSGAVAGIDDLISDLRAARSKSGVSAQDRIVLECQCSGFSVGCAASTLGATVKFTDKAAVYLFEHDQRGRIDMTMKYMDMRQLTVTATRLQFKVRRKLEHFANEYDPARRADYLTIDFSSPADVKQFLETVRPLIRC
eukprot:TRINITY_DN25381_c0_g1_i2.p1 TRINITY_DN25381_c0_g1~~TRINITY_DN25381_c0_g1_i2.p1  ORF type:complete len:231 (+),score=22.82 TRINITY_DN25381_c0_g1_i2:167-859(+)